MSDLFDYCASVGTQADASINITALVTDHPPVSEVPQPATYQRKGLVNTLLFTDETKAKFEKNYSYCYNWKNSDGVDPYAPYDLTGLSTNDKITRKHVGGVGKNISIQDKQGCFYIQSVIKNNFTHSAEHAHPNGKSKYAGCFNLEQAVHFTSKNEAYATALPFRLYTDASEQPVVRCEWVHPSGGRICREDMNATDREEIFGFSFKVLKEDFDNDDDEFSIILQLHDLPDSGEVSRVPPIAITLEKGLLGLGIHWCPLEINTKENDFDDAYPLGPCPWDTWIDGVLHVKYDYRPASDPNCDGFVKLWLRYDGQIDPTTQVATNNPVLLVNRINQPNMYNDNRYPYLKGGVYKRKFPLEKGSNRRRVFYANIRIAHPTLIDGEKYYPKYEDVAPDRIGS